MSATINNLFGNSGGISAEYGQESAPQTTPPRDPLANQQPPPPAARTSPESTPATQIAAQTGIDRAALLKADLTTQVTTQSTPANPQTAQERGVRLVIDTRTLDPDTPDLSRAVAHLSLIQYGLTADEADAYLAEHPQFDFRSNAGRGASVGDESLRARVASGNVENTMTAETVREIEEWRASLAGVEVVSSETPDARSTEGFGSFLDGVVRGDFSDNDSWSTTAGQIVGGLNPLADARDIAAGVTHIVQGKEGALFELGTATLGAVPIIGDAGKAILKGGKKVAGELAKETAERASREGAEEVTDAARLTNTTPPAKAVPEQIVDNALKESFQTRRLQFGDQTFQLDYPGMKHILQRHHPDFWDGSIKENQTFLDPKMSIQEVGDAVEAVMKQNRETLIREGSNDVYRMSGTYKGQEYVLGMNNGRVGMFYPKPN